MTKEIAFLKSPHANARPAGSSIDLIVLHAISLPDGTFEMANVSDFFLGKLNASAHPSFQDLQSVHVSAHFVVARNGSITQFVSTNSRAWHAGESTWLGKDNCNDYSIGIEIIGDEKQPFTHKQYTETARLCRTLMATYASATKDRIVGHQDIAPTRKWDPGKQWDWQHFHRSLSHIQNLHMNFKA
jgi:AmpD protein